MSTTMIYDRIFLESKEGITPCVCWGDSRTWERTISGHERRPRSWGVLGRHLGVPRNQLMKNLESKADTIYWSTYKGKYMDEAVYLRWLKAANKGATTIERVLEANHMVSACCYVSVWKNLNREVKNHAYISTTAELDEWIRKTRVFMEEMKRQNFDSYPVIDFGIGRLSKPLPAGTDLEKKVILKRGSYYLTELTETTSRWDAVPLDALEFSLQDAAAIKTQFLGKVRMVDTRLKDAPYNAVLKFVSGPKAGFYVRKRTKGHLHLASNAMSAQRYRNEAEAERVRQRIQPAFTNAGELEVEIFR